MSRALVALRLSRPVHVAGQRYEAGAEIEVDAQDAVYIVGADRAVYLEPDGAARAAAAARAEALAAARRAGPVRQ